MANCPKCHGEGIVNGRQRYRCKGCGYRHTVAERGAVRRQALQLYLEGMGFRAIDRFLEAGHVAVHYWVKSFGKAVESARNTGDEVKVVEMDELHSHVGRKKNYRWVWTAIDRHGRRFLGCAVDSRDAERLWADIERPGMKL